MVVNNNFGGATAGGPKFKPEGAVSGRPTSSYQTDLAGLNFNQAKATLAAGEKKCAEFNIYDEVANISISPSQVDKFANVTGNNGRGSSSGVVAGTETNSIPKNLGPKIQGSSASSAVGNGIIKRTQADENIFQNIKKASLAPSGNGNPPIRPTGRAPASTAGTRPTGQPNRVATTRARSQSQQHRSESDPQDQDCCSIVCWAVLIFLCYSVFVGVKTCADGKCDIKRQSVQSVPLPAQASRPSAPLDVKRNTKNQNNITNPVHALLKGCTKAPFDCIEARYQNLTKQKDQLENNLKRTIDERDYYEGAVTQLAGNYTVLSKKLNQTEEALQRALCNYKKFKNYTDSRFLQNLKNQTFLGIRLRKVEDRLQEMAIHFMEDMDHLMSQQLQRDRELSDVRRTVARLTDKVFPKNEASYFSKASGLLFIFVVSVHGIANLI